MRKLNYLIVDVFTDRQFGGNQLAVFPEPGNLTDQEMQKIAREFNFSETTFIFPPQSKTNDAAIRIFTPQAEVPMAGHPTIGTAYVFLNTLKKKPVAADHLIFEEKIGPIRVDFRKDGTLYVNLKMYQPLPQFGPVVEKRKSIAELLSLKETDLLNKPCECVSCGNRFLFVPVNSLAAVKVSNYQSHLAAKIPEADMVYVFSLETENGGTTHGRMFAPAYGVPEDPATGSASGPLGCYLVRHQLSDGMGIICEQGYELGRPSRLNVDIKHEQGNVLEVTVAGEVVLSASGVFYLQ